MNKISSLDLYLKANGIEVNATKNEKNTLVYIN